nr:helix-turn-helix transcriptional regulator [Nocardiopsis sinuspersici]
MPSKRAFVDEAAAAQFASELTRLRSAADLSQRELGRRTGTSGQQVGAIERGQRNPSRQFAELADKALNANSALLNLWPQGRSAPHRWLQEYVDLEAKALAICQFQAQVVPALLQTESYARSTLEAACPPSPPQRVNDLLKTRMERQLLLNRATPPMVQYVVDENAFRRPIGGPEAMQEQLEQVIERAGSPFISLQVLPYDRGAHAGLEGTFTLLGMTPVEYVVYGETAGRGQIFTDVDVVSATTHRFGALRALALSPAESLEFVRSLVEREAP